MSALRLGLPSKGRMRDDATACFSAAGMHIRRTGAVREYAAALSGVDHVEIALLQAGEMPAKLASGELHLAITGEDLIRERIEHWDEKVALLRPLGFGHADLIVAVPNFWVDVSSLHDLDEAAAAFRAHHGAPLRIATKYLRLTREFFKAHGVADYAIVESLGATEGAPAAGAAEAIVDITSSGETLRANNLKILDDGLILRSEAQLCAALKADWSETARAALSDIMARLEARAAAKAARKLTARPAAALAGQLASALAALDAQIHSSADGEMEAICFEDQVEHALKAIRASGAEQISVSALDMLYGPPGPALEGFFDRL